MNEIILEVKGLSKNFGALQAVDDVSFTVREGEMRAVIGPNGAGKSTLMDLISNRTTPSSGEVLYKGENIAYLAPEKIVRKGISKCFQITQVFPDLTVFENVQLAIINKERKLFKFLPVKRDYFKEEVDHYLNLVGIVHESEVKAKFLAYGEQRRLDIAIALAMEPTLLILDEPAAGVSRNEAYTLMDLIVKLGRESGTTMLFIEHDMDIIFKYADYISVMHNGRMIATGTLEEIRENKFVQEAYLGGTQDE